MSGQTGVSSALTFLHRSLLQFDAALRDRRRFIALSTVASTGSADSLVRTDVRTVVVRAWHDAPPVWRFHTDRRAAKVDMIPMSHRMNAVFWDAPQQLQVRMEGVPEECHDPMTVLSAWNDLGERGQQSFRRNEVPGSELEHPETLTFSEAAHDASGARISPHFMLVSVAVTAVDCLSLAHDPHHRVKADWSAEGWKARWVAP